MGSLFLPLMLSCAVVIVQHMFLTDNRDELMRLIMGSAQSNIGYSVG